MTSNDILELLDKLMYPYYYGEYNNQWETIVSEIKKLGKDLEEARQRMASLENASRNCYTCIFWNNGKTIPEECIKCKRVFEFRHVTKNLRNNWIFDEERFAVK